MQLYPGSEVTRCAGLTGFHCLRVLAICTIKWSRCLRRVFARLRGYVAYSIKHRARDFCFLQAGLSQFIRQDPVVEAWICLLAFPAGRTMEEDEGSEN